MEKIYSNDDKTKAEQSMDAAISSVTSLELTSALKISKIGVERQREYRVRQKQKISSKPKKKTKTPAERQREYRLRRKQKMLSNLKKKIKSLAERQQEYRLRQKQKLLNNPEQKKKFLEKKIEYQRQYRLKKKLEKAQKINGDKPAIKIKANYQREYRLRTKFRPQLYSSSEIPTAKPKKEAKEQMQNVIEFRKLKRVQQNPTEDHNINEIYQLKSQPIPTLHFGENRIQQISNQDLDSFEFNELMQPQDSYEGDYGEHLDTVIKGKHIDNENHFNTNEKSPAEHDSSHLIISYCSHKSVHNLFNKTFVKYSFGHVCNICAHQRCPKDVKNGKFDGENVLKQITKEIGCARLSIRVRAPITVVAAVLLCALIGCWSRDHVQLYRQYSEDNVVMKTEGQTDDVMIKQELDIGPTVLQPKTTSCMLRMQTMMEVAGSNFQQCPMRPRRCYRGPRVRREVLAERPKPVTPATHSDVKDCRGIHVTVKVEFDSDGVIAHQGLNSKDAGAWECSVTNTGVSVKDVLTNSGSLQQ
ncbi:hypothetical protein EVAR_64163_1 [Eumeta japonica]|uniref:Uncharacterized protein n=1 Tax=Eumeta variegata TaxID=151549 RepID=A0A4C1ZMU8_EUMVA|nr:hypothetical protein EVAR_64163_1 [Eumeta japonica]